MNVYLAHGKIYQTKQKNGTLSTPRRMFSRIASVFMKVVGRVATMMVFMVQNGKENNRANGAGPIYQMKSNHRCIWFAYVCINLSYNYLETMTL